MFDQNKICEKGHGSVFDILSWQSKTDWKIIIVWNTQQINFCSK